MALVHLAVSLRLIAAVAVAVSVGILPALAHASPGSQSTTPEAAGAGGLVASPQSAPLVQGMSPILARVHVGADPWGIAANPTTHRVYVSNQGGNSVSVIDGSTYTVVATIPVGAAPWAQVALNVNTNRVYVSNNGSDSASVIDGGSNTVIATVGGLKSAPEGIAVHTGWNRIYVGHSANQLSVIDGMTNSVTGILNTDPSNHSVVVDENADRAYVCRTAPSVTSVMDLATGEKIGEYGASGFMAFNPNTNRLYIAELDSPALTVIDTVSDRTIASIVLNTGWGSPAINVKTNCVYAPNPGKGTVSVIDAATNTLVGTIGGFDPWVFAAAVDSDAGLVYVTERNWNTVAVVLATVCSADPPVTPTATPTPTMTFTPTPTATPTHTLTPVPGAIGGIAWYDANGDGALEDDEPGLYGVRVSLYRAGLMIGQQYTRGDGRYRFASLPPAEYVVRESQPKWLSYSTTPNELALNLVAAAERTANFGDWDGLRLYLPLIRRK